MAEGKVDVSHAQMSFGQKVVSGALGTGLSLGANMLNGAINNFWNKRAEERAYDRTRQWTRQQYKDMVDGRRKAGLNPYDVDGADAPSIVGASSTDTNSGVNAMQDIALAQQMKNDTMVAESTAYRNYAEGNALLNKDTRDDEIHDLKLRELAVSIENTELRNRVLSVDADIAEATKQFEIDKSFQNLQNLRMQYQQQIANILETNWSVQEKRANCQKMYMECVYLEVQARLAEMGIEATRADIAHAYAEIAYLAKRGKLLDAQIVTETKRANEITSHINYLNAGARKLNIEADEMPKNMASQRAYYYMSGGAQISDAVIDGVSVALTKGLSNKVMQGGPNDYPTTVGVNPNWYGVDNYTTTPGY